MRAKDGDPLQGRALLALFLVFTQAVVTKGLKRKHRMSCPIKGAGFASLMPTCWSLPVS